MSPLAFVVQVAAVVLAVAGAAKIADPRAVCRSMEAARLPASPLIGRLLGVGEVAVGASVLALGGAAPAAAMAVWYSGLVLYLVANRLRGLDVPCGCVGETERPAGAAHLAVDAIATAAAAVAVARPVGDVTGWLDAGGAGTLALAAIALVGAAIVVVVLPGRIGRSGAPH